MITLLEYLSDNSVSPDYFEENFFTKYFTGKIEQDALKEFKAMLKTTKITKLQKNKALADIDMAINDSNRIVTTATISGFFTELGFTAVSGGIAPFIKMVIRIMNSGSRAKQREALYAIRAEIKKMKTVG